MIQSTSVTQIKPATSSEVVQKEYSESPRIPSITKLNEHEMVSSRNTWPNRGCSKSGDISKNLQCRVSVCRTCLCHHLTILISIYYQNMICCITI